ncbi:MAG: NAD-dependent epimerase/dehydratase family protein [Gemmatimonadota bacterium]|nr:NAD-dependent epimerase/dehydratase family protein [Gemmatimonadota bacterium]
MKILVTGGTGVVGVSTVTALVRHGHEVRLVSRHAEHHARRWAEGVEAWPGDIADAESIRGCADGCDVVLHLAAVVDESPPDATFDRVNVRGTRNIVREAERAGVPKLVFVSSLGCDRGSSPYHQSKRAGERIVRDFDGDWIIVRPGSVYGPGDEQISLLLNMIRTLPAIPVLGGGDDTFQPIWHEDLAEALVRTIERDDLAREVLEIAGPELTSQNDLIERLSKITARVPVRVPLPDFLAKTGIRALGVVGIDVPFSDSQLAMLREGNVIADPEANGLTNILGVTPTALQRGLELLADVQEEQLPDEGVGALLRKRFWADIERSRHDPDSLFDYFRAHFNELTPGFVEVGAEPGTPSVVEEGATLTLSLPLRGHIQVRVPEASDRRITLLTLSGHPLAGAVRFLFEYHGADVRFETQVYDRAANVVDFVTMRIVGDFIQNRAWEAVVQNVVRASGGAMRDGVKSESRSLSSDEARSVESWLDALVTRMKREEVAK